MTEHRVSASQVAEWRLCRRKWAWRQVDGVDAPPHRSAALGTAVHAVLEDHLAGRPLPASREAEILRPGLRHLPLPGSARSEAAFTFDRGGITYTGRVDAEVTDGAVWTPARQEVRGDPVVFDLKTTSDFQWAKDEEELRRDPQVLVYAARALRERADAAGVTLRWVYVRTRGSPASEVREVRLSRDEVEEGMRAVDDDARAILEAKAAGRGAMTLPANPRACRAFGGCPHEERCGLSPEERLVGIMSQGSLTEQMRQRKAEAEAARPTASAVESINPPEGPAPAPAVAAVAAVVPIAAAPAKPPAKPRAAKPSAPPGLPAAPERQGFTLYVDCWPIRTAQLVVPLSQLARPVLDEIQEETGLPDYRLVEFGRGPAMFAAAMRQYMTRNPLPTSVGVVLHTRDAVGQHSLSLLEELAGTVVQGT